MKFLRMPLYFIMSFFSKMTACLCIGWNCIVFLMYYISISYIHKYFRIYLLCEFIRFSPCT